MNKTIVMAAAALACLALAGCMSDAEFKAADTARAQTYFGPHATSASWTGHSYLVKYDDGTSDLR